MKKWLTFILLLVTITATFYPCCIEDECGGDEITTSISNPIEEKSEGNCSPFISCGTCPGFTQLANAVELPIIIEEKPEHHTSIISVPLSTYTASLLQPPRFA